MLRRLLLVSACAGAVLMGPAVANAEVDAAQQKCLIPTGTIIDEICGIKIDKLQAFFGGGGASIPGFPGVVTPPVVGPPVVGPPVIKPPVVKPPVSSGYDDYDY